MNKNDNKNSDLSNTEIKGIKKVWSSPKIHNLAQKNMSGAEGKPTFNPTETGFGTFGPS
jgi:hypothetical protein